MENDKIQDFNYLDVRRLSQMRVKIDYDTTLESVWKNLYKYAPWACVGLIMAAIVRNGPPLNISWIVVCLLVISLISYIFSKMTDNYYIADTADKRIYYHFSFLKIKYIKESARFSDCIGIAVDCKYRARRTRYWYEYAVVLLTVDRKIIRMSDWKEISWADMNAEAQILSEILGLPHIPGQDRSTIKFDRVNFSEYKPVFVKTEGPDFLLKK